MENCTLLTLRTQKSNILLPAAYVLPSLLPLTPDTNKAEDKQSDQNQASNSDLK